MRECDLSILPRKHGGIDWVSSIGYDVPFVYDEIKGTFKIIDYTSKGQKITLSYNGATHSLATSVLRAGRLGSIVGKRNRDYIYEINEILSKNGKGKVIDRFRKGEGKRNTRFYSVECLDCNMTYDRSEGHLKERGVKCPFCNNGTSYPEKFVFSFLSQLQVEFKREYIFSFAPNKRYDFYLPNENVVVEVHGNQHYSNNGFGVFGGRTLEEEKQNDILKEQLALKNGIQYYVVIDAQKSELEWIKDSIINSQLGKIFDLTSVNWNECHEYAVGNLTKLICSLFVEDDSNITEKIAKEINTSRSTVAKHLKRGADLGWCNYNPNIIQKLNGTRKNKMGSPIICLETGQEFETIAECGRLSKEVFGVELNPNKISLVCNGMLNSHRGYTFAFKEKESVNHDRTFNNPLAKEICLFKANNDNFTAKEIAQKFGVDRSTVVSYLKKGTKFGWCNYDVEKEKALGQLKAKENTKTIPIRVIKDGVVLGEYESARKIEEISIDVFGVKFASGSIREVCTKRKKTHRGYVFEYIKEEEECQVV